ncbi:MAG: chloride channel protein [bacterium]
MSRALTAVWRQTVWLLASLAAGAGALWFIYAERWSLEYAAQLHAKSPYWQALLVFVGMIVISRLRDRVFPGTEGTGIPQTIVALRLGEGPGRKKVLSPRIMLGKLVLMTFGLFAGATIGREGPSVHIAACCLYGVRRIGRFSPSHVQRGLILAGGAAGIGAAFNAPIAGFLFAFEEIGRSFEKENASIIMRTPIIACLLCVAVLGHYMFYGQVDTDFPTVRAWLWVPAIGLGGGLLGGAFARAVVETTPRVLRLGRRRPYLVAGSIGLGLAVLGLLSDGSSYGGGDAQTRATLLRGEALPVYYVFAKAAASFLSLVSAIPGGLFTPSLSVGAALGDLLAPFAHDVPRQAILLIAMAAYFGGVVQSPLTAAVIVVEMTNARLMLLPLLAASILAYHASRLVCPVAIYEALADAFMGRLRGAPGSAGEPGA